MLVGRIAQGRGSAPSRGGRHPFHETTIIAETGRRRNRIPSEAYVVGDHNLGHGGGWTDYKQPGLAPYLDAWYEPGVDDYYRAQHAIKMAAAHIHCTRGRVHASRNRNT